MRISFIYLLLCIFPFFNAAGEKSQQTAAPLPIDSLFNLASGYRHNAGYDSAIHYFKKIINKYQHQETTDKYCQSIVQLAETYRIIRQLDSAGFYIGLAHEKAAQYAAPGDLVFADIYQVSGAIALSSGNYPQAKDDLNRSIRIREGITGQQDTSLAYAYNKLGNYYWFTYNYDSALICYRQALRLALSKHNQNNTESASYYQNIGLIYRTSGLYSEAEVYLRKSLEIKRIILSKDDLSLANSYKNLGLFYFQTSKYDKAYEYYKISEEIYLKHFDKDHYSLAWIYIQQGNCFLVWGDNENALIYYFKAMSIYEQDYYANRKDIMSLAMNIGRIYDNMGLYDDAIKYYLESADNKTDPAIIKTYRNLANVYVKLGEYDKADHYYKLSIAESIRFFGNESFDLALSYRYFGNFKITVLNDDTGLQYYQKALDILVKLFGEKNRDVADVMTFTGDYYLGKKMYDTALDWYQQSLVSAVAVFDDLSISKNPGIRDLDPDPYILRYIIHKADALLQYYFNETHNTEDLKLSLQTYKLATQLIDKIRSEYVAEGSKLYLTNAVYKVFNNIIILLDELYTLTNDPALLSESFKYAEKEKSAVLLGVLRDAGARISGNIPTRYLEQEKGLKIEINTYNSLLNDEGQKKTPDKKKIRLWRDKLFELKLQHDSLITYMEEHYPEYYQLKYETSGISKEQVQKNLLEDETLIEYVLTDTLIFSFVITKDTFHIHTSRRDSSLITDINTVVKSKNNPYNIPLFEEADYYTWLNASYNLYITLFRPIEHFISSQRLIIIPGGELSYLPFEALLSSNRTKKIKEYRNLSYLIYKYTISYAPSATILFNEDHEAAPLENISLIAFAPGYRSDVTPDTIFGKPYMIRPDHLPGAIEEASSISGYFDGAVYINEKALESTFKDQAYDYDIIHFAMHARINDQDPMYSKMVFEPGVDSLDDGLLNTYEIYNMDLNGKLAVLSSCKTATGKLEKGEGMMNLARAFFYAGIPSVLATLWKVDDRTSAKLINHFYKYLSRGYAKDEALRQAKLDHLDKAERSKAHPYFWAGYVLIGNAKPIVLKEPFSSTIYALLLIPAMLAILVFLVFRAKRNRS